MTTLLVDIQPMPWVPGGLLGHHVIDTDDTIRPMDCDQKYWGGRVIALNDLSEMSVRQSRTPAAESAERVIELITPIAITT